PNTNHATLVPAGAVALKWIVILPVAGCATAARTAIVPVSVCTSANTLDCAVSPPGTGTLTDAAEVASVTAPLRENAATPCTESGAPWPAPATGPPAGPASPTASTAGCALPEVACSAAAVALAVVVAFSAEPVPCCVAAIAADAFAAFDVVTFTPGPRPACAT